MARENSSPLDRLLAGFGRAVEDVRSKLIEEGWFGRRTANPSAAQRLGWERDALSDVPDEFFVDRASLVRRPSFEEAWRTREPGGSDLPGDPEDWFAHRVFGEQRAQRIPDETPEPGELGPDFDR